MIYATDALTTPFLTNGANATAVDPSNCWATIATTSPGGTSVADDQTVTVGPTTTYYNPQGAAIISTNSGTITPTSGTPTPFQSTTATVTNPDTTTTEYTSTLLPTSGSSGLVTVNTDDNGITVVGTGQASEVVNDDGYKVLAASSSPPGSCPTVSAYGVDGNGNSVLYGVYTDPVPTPTYVGGISTASVQFSVNNGGVLNSVASCIPYVGSAWSMECASICRWWLYFLPKSKHCISMAISQSTTTRNPAWD
jgi:hypothetical protein